MLKSQNKTYLIVLLSALMLVTVGGIVYIFQTMDENIPASAPTPPPIVPEETPTQNPSEPPAPKTETLEANFDEVGNLSNWDAATETHTENWKLLYEKPGNPALSVTLVFTENSLCDFGTGETQCNSNELNNGERVRVEGQQENDQVTVIFLEKR